MNVVATAGGELVEVQGTGERRSFRRDELDRLLDLAFAGIRELAEKQIASLGSTLEEVEGVRAKGRRQKAAPKNERDLWGRPG